MIGEPKIEKAGAEVEKEKYSVTIKFEYDYSDGPIERGEETIEVSAISQSEAENEAGKILLVRLENYHGKGDPYFETLKCEKVSADE